MHPLYWPLYDKMILSFKIQFAIFAKSDEYSWIIVLQLQRRDKKVKNLFFHDGCRIKTVIFGYHSSKSARWFRKRLIKHAVHFVFKIWWFYCLYCLNMFKVNNNALKIFVKNQIKLWDRIFDHSSTLSTFPEFYVSFPSKDHLHIFSISLMIFNHVSWWLIFIFLILVINIVKRFT